MEEDFAILKKLQQEHLKEIDRLNNIINKFEKHLEQTIIKFTQFNKERYDVNTYIYYTEKLLLKLQELKGSEKE